MGHELGGSRVEMLKHWHVRVRWWYAVLSSKRLEELICSFCSWFSCSLCDDCAGGIAVMGPLKCQLKQRGKSQTGSYTLRPYASCSED